MVFGRYPLLDPSFVELQRCDWVVVWVYVIVLVCCVNMGLEFGLGMTKVDNKVVFLKLGLPHFHE